MSACCERWATGCWDVTAVRTASGAAAGWESGRGCWAFGLVGSEPVETDIRAGDAVCAMRCWRWESAGL